MMRAPVFVLLIVCAAAPRLTAQERDLSGQRESFQRAVVHNGKWLTAASVAALIVFAQREHSQSRREWSALLEGTEGGVKVLAVYIVEKGKPIASPAP